MARYSQPNLPNHCDRSARERASQRGGWPTGAQENAASDVLAVLAAIDSAPLVAALGLRQAAYTVVRERRVRDGRLDVVVLNADDSPAALIEMKGASTLRPGQPDLDEHYAKTFDESPRVYLCSLDGDEDLPGDEWTLLGLADLFGAWQHHTHPGAAWLPTEIAAIYRRWDAQADGRIGDLTGWCVPDLITRRLVRDLDSELEKFCDGSTAQALRTRGGFPSLMAWRKHPTGSDEAWFGVDVRCRHRGGDQRFWIFRPCVDVYSKHQSFEAARGEAARLARASGTTMSATAIINSLGRGATSPLAQHLSAGAHDGFRRRSTSGEEAFFHDRHTRLATQLELDVTTVTRHDLAQMILNVLDHLVNGAQSRT